MTLSFLLTSATLRERARLAMGQAIEALTAGDVVRWTNLKAKARELDARAEILGLAKRDREKSA